MSCVRRSYSYKWTSDTAFYLLVWVLSHSDKLPEHKQKRQSFRDIFWEGRICWILLSHSSAVVPLQQQCKGNTDVLNLGCTWQSPKVGMTQNCYLSFPIPLYTHLPEPKPNTTEDRVPLIQGRCAFGPKEQFLVMQCDWYLLVLNILFCSTIFTTGIKVTWFKKI